MVLLFRYLKDIHDGLLDRRLLGGSIHNPLDGGSIAVSPGSGCHLCAEPFLRFVQVDEPMLDRLFEIIRRHLPPPFHYVV